MARYKPVDYSQGQFIPISFEHQILPGSFEHALSYIVDNKLDFKSLDAKHVNDNAGAPAYDPRVMLKIVLYAYARGMISSREIEAACRQNVVMMALSANTRPHFTTIAQFIRELGPAVQKLFVDVLMCCDELGLIGKEMFAVDGCKMPSNASKEWSGTREDFQRRKAKFNEAVERLLHRHRDMDKNGLPEAVAGMRRREEKAIESFKAKTAKIEKWLREHPEDKKGARGAAVKSSVTDPDSAKMASGHGVIQGYNGLAMVDAKHQVIVGAEAFGKGHEAELLKPMVEQVRENFQRIGEEDIYRKAKLTADSGFHSEESVKALADEGIDGYVPDKRFRQRDAAFETAQRHRDRKALIGRSVPPDRDFFTSEEFVLNQQNGKLVCPAGNELYVKDRNFYTSKGYYGTQYMAKRTDCRTCQLRARCLRNSKSPARTVFKIAGRRGVGPDGSFSHKMIRKISTEVGRFLYGMRMGTVEPVFANLCHMLGLDRFTLRGNGKVNTQWRLYALVHNIHKIQRYGWAGSE
ncbi:MAG TPA: IS1182 family transposase [Elusimicrobia bacterium]|nr:IS1182 family transposase [Elusimicrobiota bacterium]